MIRFTHTDSEAECDDCGERFKGMDAQHWAADHVRDTGHLVKLRNLIDVEPEPTGWAAIKPGARWNAQIEQSCDAGNWRKSGKSSK
jgi:hypothetical protein